MAFWLFLAQLNFILGVINPQKRTCWVLAKQASFYKHIRPGVLAASQLPPALTDAHGTFHKPASW